MATLDDTEINDNGFLKIPVGSSSERPSNPQEGDFRYNTDNGSLEFYNGTEWVNV